MVLAVLPSAAAGQTDTLTVADSLQRATLPALPAGVSVVDLQVGDALFHGRGGCFVCHGVDGEGVAGAANALTLGVSHIARELPLIDSVVTHGIRDDVTRSPVAMPGRGARSDLTEEEIHAVAAYVWAISGVRGEPWDGGHGSHDALVPTYAATGAEGPPGDSATLGRLSIFDPAGPAAHELARHGWWLTWIAIVVTVIVTALVIWTVRLARRVPDEAMVERVTMRLLVGGGAATVLILGLTFTYSVRALAGVNTPAEDPVIAVEIVGHQWWWEIRYLDPDASRQVVTANELHIPAGLPVEIRLESADVIHSLWAPSLNGKKDAIPGRTNLFWLEADAPGVYRGQCAEYCGVQHANMALQVVAHPYDAFREWLARQRAPAPEPDDPVAAMGRRAFMDVGCAACHRIRGTDARGIAGPDLTHVAGRDFLAAGAVPNTRGYLAGWIADAPALKPGTLMPTVPMSAAQINALVTYLETLR